MENFHRNSMNLRNLGYNKASYRDHLGAPPMSDADDVAFATAEKLLQKEVDQKMWDFHNQLEKRRAVHSNDHCSADWSVRYVIGQHKEDGTTQFEKKLKPRDSCAFKTLCRWFTENGVAACGRCTFNSCGIESKVDQRDPDTIRYQNDDDDWDEGAAY